MVAENSETQSVSEMSIALLVKTIRERDGLSLEGLGRLMGVSYVTVSHWQSGKRIPQARHLRRLRELAKNDLLPVATDARQILVIAAKPDAAVVLAQMVRDASAVLGVEADVTAESDGMRALVKLGALKPSVIFVTYPMAGLDVAHLVAGTWEFPDVDVDLFVVITDGTTATPLTTKANVMTLTTPITLGSIGEALRKTSLVSQTAGARR